MRDKTINRIEAIVPFTDEYISVVLNGKNLILTGKNGSGKTALIKLLQRRLGFYIDTSNDSIDTHILDFQNIQRHKYLDHNPKKLDYRYLENIKNFLSLRGNMYIEPCQKYDFRMLKKDVGIEHFVDFVSFFEANRQSRIRMPAGASPVSQVLTNNKRQLIENGIHNELEQHVVNLYVKKSILLSQDPNDKTALSISKWIDKFVDNLRILLEDETANLKFNDENYKLYIEQNDKQPYSFQQLSSGYSAVFYVFFHLLIKSEMQDVSPEGLQGIAIIDEIDAHLHVSLQKKILPFLTNLFPMTQFIVTTHSPFVLTSVRDAVIYDLSSKQQVDNLSAYSYEAVVEGLFGELSSSNNLNKNIEDIATMLSSTNPDHNKIRNLVELIERSVDFDVSKIDAESLFFINKAKYEISNKSKIME